ncbi:MAG TPA: carboxypeptidase-like regulatory domain-containing protein, partial [Pseudomonadales bacterium]
FVQSRLGSVAGRLTLPDGSGLDQGVDRISILVDGRPHTAVLQGRHFFVRGVLPGVHVVTLGSEYLPMGISPQKQRYRVKVASAATSVVDFVVHEEYGLAGQVTDPVGLGVVGSRVEATAEDGTLAGFAYTDGYGYYRFAGLVPGTYRVGLVGAEGQGPAVQVSIVDEFVFDVDIRAP